MTKAPAFQLYAADFYMDTASWTNAQVGAYLRLLLHEWINGPLPSDMASLARIACVSDVRTMYKIWLATVGKKFTATDGNLLINKRLEEEREKQRINREIQKVKGISGATKRWKDHIAPAIAQAQPKHSSSSSTSIKKEIEKKEKRKLTLTDEEWMNEIKNNPAYKSINVEIEKGKCEAWCLTNGKIMSRRRLVNWLNRAEKPLGGGYGGKQGGSGERKGGPGVCSREGEPSPTISDDERARNIERVRSIVAGIGRGIQTG